MNGYKPCPLCGSTIPDEPNELDELRAEVERLRAQRALENDDLARSFDMGLEKGAATERGRVVSWLRKRHAATQEWEGCDNATSRTYDLASDAVERGEHLKEDAVERPRTSRSRRRTP